MKQGWLKSKDTFLRVLRVAPVVLRVNIGQEMG